MTAEQLRNSILQEAISGRLVPQDPNDEPASALLARIREEKARLVKAKQISKRDFEVLPITEDDVDYEIPTSWKWVRLGDIFKHSTGKALNEANKKGCLHDYITTSNVYWGYFKLDKLRQMYYTEDEKEKCMATKGDLLVLEGGDVGRAAIWDRDYDIFLQNHIHKLRAYVPVCTEFYYYCLYLFHDMGLVGGKGIGIQGLSSGALHQIIFPLPPLAEQKRIVAKLEELLPIVEQYGKAQTELDELNAALPARLRQSILQEAISGRLVPQDENETADGLKEQLLQAVNNSPLKKKWNSEPIEEDEVPFDIPENWKWIRLGDIVYTQTGLSYSKGDLEKKVSNPIRVLRGGNIQSGSWCTKDDDVMIAPEFVKKDIFLKKNSFITPAVTSLEHLGKTALIREDHKDIVAGGFVLYLMPYDDKNDALMEYLAYFFQSAFYNSFCKTITNKSGQAFWNISREKLLKLTIPLPPLAEQQRIVAKIEELFEQIDKITK